MIGPWWFVPGPSVIGPEGILEMSSFDKCSVQNTVQCTVPCTVPALHLIACMHSVECKLFLYQSRVYSFQECIYFLYSSLSLEERTGSAIRHHIKHESWGITGISINLYQYLHTV